MKKTMKLKRLLESTPGYENRKFDQSLPTLASVQKSYQEKNSIKEEESPDDNELLDALKAKLSAEGGAAGFQDLADKAADVGVNLTADMLKGMDGITQHEDGDYILDTVKEAAPKMKVYSWEKHFNAGQKELDKAANIMSMKSSGGYNNVKKDVMKVQKALNMLRSKMKSNSTEF